MTSRGRALVVAGVLAAPGWARADGGLFTVEERLARDLAETDQRAVICLADGQETLIVQTRFDGARAKVAWVIPVPAKPVVAASDTAIFEEVTELLYRRDEERRGDLVGGVSEVEVISRANVGAYDAAVLSAASGKDLQAWLAGNGFVVPKEITPLLEEYAREKAFFVAARPRSNSVVASGWLPPLSIRFAATKPVFPLRLSRLSASPTKIVLFRVARSGADPWDFETEPIGEDLAGLNALRKACPGIGAEHLVERLELDLLPGDMVRDFDASGRSIDLKTAEDWLSSVAAAEGPEGSALAKAGLQRLHDLLRNMTSKSTWPKELGARLDALAERTANRLPESEYERGHALTLLASRGRLEVLDHLCEEREHQTARIFLRPSTYGEERLRGALRAMAADEKRSPNCRYFGLFEGFRSSGDMANVKVALAMRRSSDAEVKQAAIDYLVDLDRLRKLSVGELEFSLPKPPDAVKGTDAEWNAWSSKARSGVRRQPTKR